MPQQVTAAEHLGHVYLAPRARLGTLARNGFSYLKDVFSVPGVNLYKHREERLTRQQFSFIILSMLPSTSSSSHAAVISLSGGGEVNRQEASSPSAWTTILFSGNTSKRSYQHVGLLPVSGLKM